MKLFDTHCHLDDSRFDEDREKLIENLRKGGIDRLVTAGYSLEGSKRAIELSEKYDFIYATIGISPNDVPETIEKLDEELKQIEEIYINAQKVVAVGEIGLDYYWNTENKEIQKQAFIKQIELANKLKLPIQIHTRDAVMDTLEILKNYPVIKKGIFHCCPFNRELVKEAIKLGFYISFAGPTTFKNAKNASEIIKFVPEDRMLVETDSPYLSPEPFRGKRNDPRNLQYIVKKIAEVKEKSFEDIEKTVYENANRIFNII